MQTRTSRSLKNKGRDLRVRIGELEVLFIVTMVPVFDKWSDTREDGGVL